MAGSELKFGLLLSVIDRASAPLRGIGAAFTAVGNAGKRLSELGADLRVARENVADFAQRGESALRSIISPTHDVEAALVSLKPAIANVSSDVGKSLANVRADAIKWSNEHSQSAAEYIAVTTRMLQAGRTESEALRGTSIGLRVAAGATTSALGAANTLAIVYDQLGNKTADWGTELGHIGDVLVRAKQIYGDGFDVGGLSDPLKDAAGAARDARVPIEQVIGIIGTFNKSGVLGGEAGAATKNVIEGIQAASSGLGFALQRTADGGLDLGRTLSGITTQFGDLKSLSPEMLGKFQQAFGPAWRDVSLLLSQGQQLDKNFRDLGNSAGVAARAQTDAESTMGARLASVNNQIDGLKLNLADGVLPAIKELLPALTAILTPIGQFVGTHPSLVAWVGTIGVGAVGAAKLGESVLSVAGAAASFGGGAMKAASAAGSFLGTAGKLGMSLVGMAPAFMAATVQAWAFASALLANPITWIVLAIVAAAALIYVYWEPIKKFFTGIWSEIRGAFDKGWVQGILKVLEMFSPVAWIAKGLNALTQYLFGWSLFDAASNMMKSVGRGLASVWGEITGAFKESFIGGLFKVFLLLQPLTWVVRAFSAVAPWFGSLWSRIQPSVVAGLQSIGSTFLELGGWIIDALTSLPGTLLGWYVGFWVWLGGMVFDGLRMSLEGWSMIGSWIIGALSSLPGTVLGLFGRLLSGLASIVGSIGSTLFGGITNDVGRVLSWLQSFSLIEAGANIVRTLTEGIVSMAHAPIDAMKNTVQRIRNLLPFSPAKDGPLRDLHKVKLVETVADAVRPAPLVNAMSGAAGMAMAAMAAVPPPMFAPIPAAVAQAAPVNGNGGGLTMQVSIQLGGGGGRSAVEEIEAWVRNPDNARKIAVAVQTTAGRDARAGLG